MSRWIVTFLVVILAWVQFGFVTNAKALDKKDWSTKDSIAAGLVGKMGFVGGALVGGLFLNSMPLLYTTS